MSNNKCIINGKNEESSIWVQGDVISENYQNKLDDCDLDAYFEKVDIYKNIETNINEIIKYSSYPKLKKKYKQEISDKCESIKQNLYDEIDEWHTTCELLNVKHNDSIDVIKQLTNMNKQILDEKELIVKERDELIDENNELIDEYNELVDKNDDIIKERDELFDENEQLKKYVLKHITSISNQILCEKEAILKEKNELLIQNNELKNEISGLKRKRESFFGIF